MILDDVVCLPAHEFHPSLPRTITEEDMVVGRCCCFILNMMSTMELRHDCEHLRWLAKSPDLNPIENVLGDSCSESLKVGIHDDVSEHEEAVNDAWLAVCQMN